MESRDRLQQGLAGLRALLRQDVRRALARLGATFGPRREPPRRLIERAGYTVRERHSIPGRAREAGTLPVPGWLFHSLLRGMRDGYAVYVFEPATPR